MYRTQFCQCFDIRTETTRTASFTFTFLFLHTHTGTIAKNMISPPKQRNQMELDAAIMLASFTADTSNASEEVVVPPLATERRSLQSAGKQHNNTISSNNLMNLGVDNVTIPSTMVRIIHSTSIYFFLSTPPN